MHGEGSFTEKMDQTLYRIALEYESADQFAEQLPPDYAEGTDIDSLADDRCLIAEPALVLFPTVALPSDTDLSTLDSRLSPVNLSQPAMYCSYSSRSPMI